MPNAWLGHTKLISCFTDPAGLIFFLYRFSHYKNKSNISYLNIYQLSLQHSGPLESSPGSYSLLVSDSVGIMSSCCLLAFLLSVSLVSSRLHCLCFSVSISNS